MANLPIEHIRSVSTGFDIETYRSTNLNTINTNPIAAINELYASYTTLNSSINTLNNTSSTVKINGVKQDINFTTQNSNSTVIDKVIVGESEYTLPSGGSSSNIDIIQDVEDSSTTTVLSSDATKSYVNVYSSQLSTAIFNKLKLNNTNVDNINIITNVDNVVTGIEIPNSTNSENVTYTIPTPTAISSILSEEVDNTTAAGAKATFDAIMECFQSVSNGKTLLASAITDKGVATSSTDSFSIMSSNISSIESGGGEHIPYLYKDYTRPNVYSDIETHKPFSNSIIGANGAICIDRISELNNRSRDFYVFNTVGGLFHKYIFGDYPSQNSYTDPGIPEEIRISGINGCYYRNDDCIHMFGGYANNVEKDFHYMYNCETSTWTKSSISLPKAFNNPKPISYKDNIYIFGGTIPGSYGASSYNEIYKRTYEGVWSNVGTVPGTLINVIKVIEYNDYIYVFVNDRTDNVPKIYKFDGTTITQISCTIPGTASLFSSTDRFVVYCGEIHIFHSDSETVNGGKEYYYTNHYTMDKNNNFSYYGTITDKYIDIHAVAHVGNNNKINFINGSIHKTISRISENTTFSQRLSTDTCVLSSFWNTSVISYNSVLYMFGSPNASSERKAIHKLNTFGEWEKLDTEMPFVHNGGGDKIVIYQNKVHIFEDVQASSVKSHYTWDGTTWTKIEGLPYYPYGTSFIVYNDEIHAFGGRNEPIDCQKHYKYNGTVWAEVDTIPYYMEYCRTVIYNDEIHIIGGKNGSNQIAHYSWSTEGGFKVVCDYTELENNTTMSYNIGVDNFELIVICVMDNKIHIMYTNFHYIFNGLTWVKTEFLPNEIYIDNSTVFAIDTLTSDTVIRIFNLKYGCLQETAYSNAYYNVIDIELSSNIPFNIYKTIGLSGSDVTLNTVKHVILSKPNTVKYLADSLYM